MEASKIYGLKSAQRDSVPIKKLLISANLFHFAAHVSVTQTYFNSSNLNIPNVIYEFPNEVVDNLAKFMVSRGSIAISATIDEIPQGDEKQPKGSILIGSLPANSELTISFTYVLSIQPSLESNSFSFSIPSSLAHQLVDLSLALSATDPKAYGLEMVVSIFASSAVRSVNCASHSRAVVHLRENDPAGEAVKEKKSELSFSEFECARVTLDEESGKLNEDFKLEVSVADVSLPSLWIERISDSQRLFVLAVQPNLSSSSPSSFNEEEFECVILIDRSASMTLQMTTAIQIAKSALELLPKQNPLRVFGFGSSTEEVLVVPKTTKKEGEGGEPEAEDHRKLLGAALDNLNADLLSSDLLQALNTIIGSSTRQIRLLLISDGDVTNSSQCAAFLRTHASSIRLYAICVGSNRSDGEFLLGALCAACNGSVLSVADSNSTSASAEASSPSNAQIQAAVQSQLTSLLCRSVGFSSLQWCSGPPQPGNQFIPGIPPIISHSQSFQFFAFLNASVYAAENAAVILRTKDSTSSSPISIPLASARLVPNISLLSNLVANSLLKQLNDHTDQTKPAVVSLSKRFGIPTAYTTFVLPIEHPDAQKTFFQRASVATASSARTHKVENLKIEIDRLQRLLSSSGTDGVTIADCNIRLEKALEEYQRTPEHAMELSIVRSRRRERNEKENFAALERLRLGAFPLPSQSAPATSSSLLTVPLSSSPGAGGGGGSPMGSQIDRGSGIAKANRLRDETCPIRLLTMTADQISSLPAQSWGKFCVRGLSEEEMRGIRAVLPPFRTHQRQQLEFTDSLDLAIDQIAQRRSTNAPSPLITPSTSSPSLSGRNSGNAEGGGSGISRAASGSAILSRKFKGQTNPGAILSELNKKVAGRKASIAAAPNVPAPSHTFKNAPPAVSRVAPLVIDSVSPMKAIEPRPPPPPAVSTPQPNPSAKLPTPSPTPVSSSIAPKSISSTAEVSPNPKNLSSATSPALAKLTAQLKSAFETLARSLAQIHPNDKEIAANTRTATVTIKEIAQQQRLSGDTASADKTDALAAQLVSGVKAVLVARTTPGASQEQLLAAKNGFVPVASACRNLWSL